MIEKVVFRQLISYLTVNNLHIPQQSCFRRGYSTETSLLNVIDVITSTLNHQYYCQLVMLDISNAFDTIPHHILMSHLHLIGVRDLAFSWFTSYLSAHSSSVKIYNYFYSPFSYEIWFSPGISKRSFTFLYLFISILSIVSKYPNIYYHICR